MNYYNHVIESIKKSAEFAKAELDKASETYTKANSECTRAYHELESADITEDNSYDYARNMQWLLRKRRDAKGEWVIATKVYEAIETSLEEICEVQRRAINTHNKLSKKQSQ